MARHGPVDRWKAKGVISLKFYSIYQGLTSLGFIFLLAYTEHWQEANWPEGRVVYIHPWILFLAWAVLGFTLIMGVAQACRANGSASSVRFLGAPRRRSPDGGVHARALWTLIAGTVLRTCR